MLVNSIFAYIGPGAGLGLMGALIGLALALLSALGFVLFWPLRALVKKCKTVEAVPVASESESGTLCEER